MAAVITERDAAALGIGVPKKRAKYNNRRVQVDGIWFDSVKESKRWLVLKARQQAGEITDLRRQVPFPLHGKAGDKIASYKADFTYLEGNRYIVEDVKGGNATKTDIYRLKRKWMKAEYDIDIRET